MKQKTGMTLVEIMITFVVMSVIATLALVTVRPYNKTIKYLYSTAYSSMEKAVYNLYIADGKTFPTTGNGLCTDLQEYINANKDLCSVATYIDASDKFATGNDPDLSSETVAFIGNNGFYYHISAPVAFPTTSKYKNLKYILVFIDLNGAANPNSAIMDSDTSIINDIVYFAVLSNGTVLPMGRPVFDTAYMTARVQYPPKDYDASTNPDPKETYSAPMTFYNARGAAWGSEESENAVKTIDMESIAISSDSNLHIAHPTQTSIDTTNGCVAGDDNICDVSVVKYKR